MHNIKINDVIKFVNKIGFDIDTYKFTLKDLKKGMNIELEHGKINKLTNVTNDNIYMTGKIALAHLIERPDYYHQLDKLETQPIIYLQNKIKDKPIKPLINHVY
jgi:hypothetical protein